MYRWSTNLAVSALISSAAVVPGAAPASAVAPGQIDPSYVCPAPTGFDMPALYPNASNPSLFYQCNRAGNAYVRECAPSGAYPSLIFNPATSRCEHQTTASSANFYSESITDKVGDGPPGEVRSRLATTNLDPDGNITYTAAVDSDEPLASATLQISVPRGLTWVGGQDCFHRDGSHIAVCWVYPAAAGIESSVFTLHASLLSQGPKTVTAHFVSSTPVAVSTPADVSATCDVLTGLIVSC